MCTFYFFYDRYNTDTDKTIPIRYDIIPNHYKIHFFPFGLLLYSAYSIIVFRDHNFQNDVKMKNKTCIYKKNHSFLYQTSSILINIIIKSIVYLSFRYDIGISFMIPIRYDTFNTVHIPIYLSSKCPLPSQPLNIINVVTIDFYIIE